MAKKHGNKDLPKGAEADHGTAKLTHSQPIIIKTKVEQRWTIHLVLWVIALSTLFIAAVEAVSLYLWWTQ